MYEGFRNLALLVWALCAVNSNSYAGETVIAEENMPAAPTVVFGAARRADGSTEEVLVEQSADAPNPLGNLLPDEAAEPQSSVLKPEILPSARQPVKPVHSEVLPDAGPQGRPVVPQNGLGSQFQNTLEEADGMIYDVQAYPVDDLKVIGNPSNPQTIYSPNVNP